MSTLAREMRRIWKHDSVSVEGCAAAGDAERAEWLRIKRRERIVASLRALVSAICSQTAPEGCGYTGEFENEIQDVADAIDSV